MSTLSIVRRRITETDLLVAAAGALLGMGAFLGVSGWLGGGVLMEISGGGTAAVGLALLLTAGWVDPLAVVALSVPLPALAATTDLRVAAAAPVAALVVAAWAFRAGMLGSTAHPGALPRRSLAALLGAFAVAALLSASPLLAAREVLNFSVLMALLVVGVDLLDARSGRREACVGLLAGVAAVAGALAVLQTLGVIPGLFPRYGTSYQRAALGFGQPNALGLFLAVSVPLVEHRRKTAPTVVGRIGWGIALGAAVLGLVGTFSRGAWSGLVIGAFAPALAGRWRAAFRIWVVGLAVAVLVDLISGGALRDTIARTIGDWVVEQRALLMAAGILMFLDHPLLGVGPGGFAPQLDTYAPQLPDLFDLQPTPHNAFVQMAAETGVVGLVIFIVFIVALFRVFRRRVADASGSVEQSLALAILWSFGVLVVASLAVWPFSHGVGEAVVLMLAIGLTGGREGARPA